MKDLMRLDHHPVNLECVSLLPEHSHDRLTRQWRFPQGVPRSERPLRVAKTVTPAAGALDALTARRAAYSLSQCERELDSAMFFLLDH